MGLIDLLRQYGVVLGRGAFRKVEHPVVRAPADTFATSWSSLLGIFAISRSFRRQCSACHTIRMSPALTMALPVESMR